MKEIMEMIVEMKAEIKTLKADVAKLKKEGKPPVKRFEKPSEWALECYFQDRGSNTCVDDAKAFMDHYESNGWMVGKTPMKNWEASVRNWMKGGTKKSSVKAIGTTQKDYAAGTTIADRVNDLSWADGL